MIWFPGGWYRVSHLPADVGLFKSLPFSILAMGLGESFSGVACYEAQIVTSEESLPRKNLKLSLTPRACLQYTAIPCGVISGFQKYQNLRQG